MNNESKTAIQHVHNGILWNFSRAKELGCEIATQYEKRFPKSRQLAARSRNFSINGLQQGGRYYSPFPLFVDRAKGSIVTTVEGNILTDMWLGHFVSIDGHSPAYSETALKVALDNNRMFQIGQPGEIEVELMENFTAALGYQRIQTTLSGAEATAAACRLARTTTNRTLIVKFSGGWHGVNPWSSIATRAGTSEAQEQLGAPASAESEVCILPYNDPDSVRNIFAVKGNQIAAYL